MTQETFERELNRRADDVHGAPFSLDDVRGKAMSIRRRRRAAVAGGVAAVVALVVLVPTVLSGGSGPKSDGVDPAPPAPGHTAVLHDGTLTLPDGDTVELDIEDFRPNEMAVLADGRIVLSQQSPNVIRILSPDGTLQQEYATQSSDLTTNADDSVVTWIGGGATGDRGVRVLESGAVEPVVLPGIPAAGEFTGSVDAVLTPERLLVDGQGFTDSVLTPGGVEDLRNPDTFNVVDVSPDGSLWTVQYYPAHGDPMSGCAGLYDPETETIVAENCETAFLHFSPDGQHLVGVRGDNSMWGEAKVFDLDLELVGQWESPGGGDVIKAVAWEDAGHLLVSEVNWKNQTWSLTRVDLAWSEREVVQGPLPGGNPELVNEFLFSQ